MRLPRNPTARLRAVADIIEAHPEKHDQRGFIGYEQACPDVADFAGVGDLCGTTACVAGWAVVQAPKSQVQVAINAAPYGDFDDVAQDLLGFDDRLAGEVFYNWSNRQRRWIPDRLRALAEIPTGQRTYAEAKARGIVR